MPGDAGLSSGLEFCRSEIERRRSVQHRVVRPILLSIATFILALAMNETNDRGLSRNGLPFLALVVVWILAYLGMRARAQRELKREIDELNDLEKDISQ